ncbi:MAG: hypothetical protein PHG40_02565, partial [Candidatus Omnitrophica bacterium]|nr:hypothetical protein [Candidatus Omnitrophota bacterium]
RSVMAGTSNRYAYRLHDIDDKVVEYELAGSDQKVSVNFYGGAYSRIGDTIVGNSGDRLSGIGADETTRYDIYQPLKDYYLLRIGDKGNISPIVASIRVPAYSPEHTLRLGWGNFVVTDKYTLQVKDTLRILTRDKEGTIEVDNGVTRKATPAILKQALNKDDALLPDKEKRETLWIKSGYTSYDTADMTFTRLRVVDNSNGKVLDDSAVGIIQEDKDTGETKHVGNLAQSGHPEALPPESRLLIGEDIKSWLAENQGELADLNKAIDDFSERGDLKFFGKIMELKKFYEAKRAMLDYNPQRHFAGAQEGDYQQIDLLIRLARMDNVAAREFLKNLGVSPVLKSDDRTYRRRTLEDLSDYNISALISILNGYGGKECYINLVGKLSQKTASERTAILESIEKQSGSPIDSVANLAMLYTKARDTLDTNRPYAFLPSILAYLVNSRENPASSGRPLAIVVGPKAEADDKAALSEYDQNGAVITALENGFFVKYGEGKPGEKAVDVLSRVIPQLAGEEIPTLIMPEGHGTPTSIMFGADGVNGQITTADKEAFKNSGLARYAGPETDVVGKSCSIGACIQGENMVDVLKEGAFPYARGVYGAPEIEYGGPLITFDENKHVTDVKYRVFSSPPLDSIVNPTRSSYRASTFENRQAYKR